MGRRRRLTSLLKTGDRRRLVDKTSTLSSTTSSSSSLSSSSSPFSSPIVEVLKSSSSSPSASPSTSSSSLHPTSSPLSPSSLHPSLSSLSSSSPSSSSSSLSIAKATATMSAKMDEVRALLHTDLSRMPDVVDFIRTHVHNIDSLPRVALANMRDLSQSLIKQIAHLPAVESVLIEYLMQEDEQWAAYLSEQFKAGVAFVDAFYQGLQVFPSWVLPDTLTQRLASMPTVKEALISSFASMEKTGSDILKRFVAKNVEHMRDLQSLVTRHLDNLPSLKKLLAAHYEGIPELKHLDFVPDWMADNEFILTGYRPELLSFKRCFHSLFYLHNETGNIYTHLLGGFAFIVLAIYIVFFSGHAEELEDKILFASFWAAAITCLMCSAIFHTCCVHSSYMNVQMCKLDYLGIICLICGSTMAVEYFSFYCDPELRWFYMALTAAFGVLAAWGSASRGFEGPGKKPLRVLFFVALGATSIFPQLHFTALYGVEHLMTTVDTTWLYGISVPLYLIGSVFFAYKFPERFFPGKFDIWFHSHQLWHIFVICAAYAHYVCVHNMMHFRRISACTHENTFALGLDSY